MSMKDKIVTSCEKMIVQISFLLFK